MPAYPRVDPRGTGLYILRLRRQALHQVVSGLCRHRGQIVQRRPGPLGIHVVWGEWRDAAPVVHSGTDQRQALAAGYQIWGCLYPHLRPQHQSGHGDRRQKIIDVGVRSRLHGGVRLSPEVLHDHFLDVAEFLVHLADRMNRLGALGQILADAHQQARGERDRQPTRVRQCAAARPGLCRGCRSGPRRGPRRVAARWSPASCPSTAPPA